jgi:uncharacterized membrane protein
VELRPAVPIVRSELHVIFKYRSTPEVGRNMKHFLRRTALTLLVAEALVVFSTPLAAQEDVVQAVMFFSPTCPHCGEVIQDHLPIFFGMYGGEPTIYLDESLPENERCLYLFSNGRLEILLIDATRECGTSLYLASNVAQQIPPQRGGVPRFVMGETVLVGAAEIPSRFHDLMREAQANGGLGWPAIPGLDSAVAGFPLRAAADSQTSEIPVDSVSQAQEDTDLAPVDTTAAIGMAQADTSATEEADTAAAIESELQQPTEDARDTSVAAVADTTVRAAQATPGDSSPFDLIPDASPTMLDNLRRDPVGNTVALIVLVGMVAGVAAAFGRKPTEGATSKPHPAVLGVALIGIVVAGYLTYIETSGATAVCGPVGDCNTVQQSPYAMLFGLIPVGLLGLLGYAAIVIAWLVWNHKPGVLANHAALTAFGIALAGTLFSIYLTFLEPFIIGATCAWCIASSIAITILLLLTAGAGKRAWVRLVSQGK